MSIATRITSMEGHIEQAYDELQGLGADLTNVDKNIENISMVLDDIYDSLPSVSGEGTSLTLDDTRVGKIKSTLKGNTSQDGTPTSTSPIPVNVVSGDNEINVCGKNLFEIKTPDYIGQDAWASYGQSDYTKNNNGYTLNQRYVGIAFQFNNLEIGSQYTISFNVVGNSLFWASVGINVYSGHTETNTGSKDFYATTTTSHITYTFTASSDNRIAFNSGYTDNTTLTISNIQLEKGSQATDFEPYQGNTYNIDLPVENLVDTLTTNSAIIGSGLTYSRSNDGTISVSGTSNRAYDYGLTTTYTFKAGETYTFYCERGGTTRHNFYISFNSTNGGQLTFRYDTPSPITRTMVEDQTVRVMWSLGNNTTVDFTTRFMIEKGTKANTYTPYRTTPIELCKIGNYQDYIYKDSDKWYLHKKIRKVVLNGSENIELGTTKAITQVFKILYVLSRGVQENLGICNYFINQTGDTEKFSYLVSDADYSQLYIAINKTIVSTVQEFKTWLSTHNTIVYYPLATPTTTEITYQPLIDQLNLLEKAMSKDGQTNISQVNNDLPFIISASALKEWQESTSLNSTLSMVNPLSLGNTLNTQENNTQPIEVDNIEPLEEEENEES